MTLFDNTFFKQFVGRGSADMSYARYARILFLDMRNAIATTPQSKKPNSHMQIVVVVLGALVLLAILILVWLFVTWKVKKQRSMDSDGLPLPSFDKKLNIVTEKRKQSSASSRTPLISVSSGRMNSESGICADFGKYEYH